MEYYVKIDEEFGEYPTKWQAIDYNDLMDCDGVYVSSGENKTQMIIDACVDKYMAKKSKHIEVKS